MEKIGQIIDLTHLKENTQDSVKPSKSEKKITERDAEEIEKTLIDCGISKRYLNASKEDIDSRLWDKVAGFFKGESIFLYGTAGTGKTHLISAMIKEKVLTDQPAEITKDGHTRYYLPRYPEMTTAPDLLLNIRNNIEHEEGIINRYVEIRALVVDDLGVEKTTEWSLQTLYSIIDHRYRDMKQTVFTSNLTLDEIAKKTSDRIASRISEMCKIIELKGKDKRLQK